MKAASGVGCHFESELALNYVKNYFFGIYDFILGYYARIMVQDSLKMIDAMNAKNHPEKVIGDISDLSLLSQVGERIVLKLEGYRSIAEYNLRSSCTHRFSDIQIPFFFLSANDDPMFGN